MITLFDKWVEEEERKYDFICTKKDNFFRKCKGLAFTFLKGISNSKLTNGFKRKFRLKNINRASGVLIANEYGYDEIRMLFVIGENYGDWILVSSFLNRERRRYWDIENEKDPENSFFSYDINEAISYFETLEFKY